MLCSVSVVSESRGGVSQVGVVVMGRPVDPAHGLLVMSETWILRSNNRGLHRTVVIVVVDVWFRAIWCLGGDIVPWPVVLTLSVVPLVDLQLSLDLLPFDLIHLCRPSGVLEVAHQPIGVAGQSPVISLQILSLNKSLWAAILSVASVFKRSSFLLELMVFKNPFLDLKERSTRSDLKISV